MTDKPFQTPNKQTLGASETRNKKLDAVRFLLLRLCGYAVLRTRRLVIKLGGNGSGNGNVNGSGNATAAIPRDVTMQQQAAALGLELASRVLWDGIIIALGVQFAGARERSSLDLPEIGAEQAWALGRRQSAVRQSRKGWHWHWHWSGRR